jgi:Peptidase A4 family
LAIGSGGVTDPVVSGISGAVASALVDYINDLIGIDGWGTSKLLQDGTSDDSNANPYSWFEYLPDDQTLMSRNEVYTGDDIQAQVFYTSASSGTAHFIGHDDGIVALNVTEPNVSRNYDSSHAEFINERPEINGTFGQLTNTGETYFWDAGTENPAGTITSFANGDVFAVVMTSDGSTQALPCSSSSTILQYPEAISGETFDSQWCRAS